MTCALGSRFSRTRSIIAASALRPARLSAASSSARALAAAGFWLLSSAFAASWVQVRPVWVPCDVSPSSGIC